MNQPVKKQIERILKKYPDGGESLEAELKLLVLFAEREQLIEDRNASLRVIRNMIKIN